MTISGIVFTRSVIRKNITGALNVLVTNPNVPPQLQKHHNTKSSPTLISYKEQFMPHTTVVGRQGQHFHVE
jgi:hypothetical protein